VLRGGSWVDQLKYPNGLRCAYRYDLFPSFSFIFIGLRCVSSPGLAEEEVTFADPNLEAAVREAIGKPTGEILVSDVAGLTRLGAPERGISNLDGIQHLTQLTSLDLYDNQISDISPLMDNPGLGEGDWIDLTGNPLNDEAYEVHIPALQARGADVLFDPKTAVSEGQEVPVLPSAYALYPNTPNPFNPRTSIGYDLPEAAQVRLTIYNGLGQQVAELVSARQEAGQHTVSWNAQGCASGIYFYRLEAGSFSQTRRMVLLS
jgi:hypothetical protein